MTAIEDSIRDLLDSKPHIEESLETLLAVDQEGPWTFDDIPLDSGTFGEIVDRGIVTRVDGGYELTDPKAVRTALYGDTHDDQQPSSPLSTLPALTHHIPTVSRFTWVTLAIGLLLIVVFRAGIPFSSIFRNGDVVLASNDPYFYRYWVEYLLASDIPAWNIGALEELPEPVRHDEVLFIVTLWWWAGLVGGTPHIAGSVLAWYPIVMSVVVGLLVYWIAYRLTSDRRVGLAALLFLGVTPVNSQRMMLGFADHHAFDYVWLVFTVAALVSVVVHEAATNNITELLADRTSLIAIFALGVGVAGQVAAWRGGILMIVALPVTSFFLSISAMRRGDGQQTTNLGVLSGVVVGILLLAIVHLALDWFPPHRVVVPAVFAMGIALIVIVNRVAARLNVRPFVVLIAEVLGAGTLGLVAWVAVPGIAATGREFLSFMTQTGQADIFETYSLVAGLAGQYPGPIHFFGVLILIATIYLLWLSLHVYRTHLPSVLVLVTYAWFFFALASAQMRFAGQLSVITAVITGIGFVHLTSYLGLLDQLSFQLPLDRSVWYGATTTPSSVTFSLSDWHRAGQLFLVFLLLAGPGAYITTQSAVSGTVPDSTYETAKFIDRYAAEQNLTYPDNYVFSIWDRTRVYNYFVNGQSRSYEYARTHYFDFIRSTHPDAWYSRLRDRVGFIVIEPLQRVGQAPPETTYYRLRWTLGSATNRTQAVAHYRAIYISDDGSHRVFQVVPGAHIVGGAPPNSSFLVSHEVRLPDNRTFVYRTVATASPTGRFNITVPYPGDYRIRNRRIHVPENAVLTGKTVSLNQSATRD